MQHHALVSWSFHYECRKKKSFFLTQPAHCGSESDTAAVSTSFCFPKKSLNHAVIVTVRLRLYNLKVRLNTFKTQLLYSRATPLFKAYPG